MLDADLLDEAMRLSGEKTWSAAVTRALGEMVRRLKARRLLELQGSGAWTGDLSQVREDKPRRKTGRK